VVVREQFLCAPVEKNRWRHHSNKQDHLVCYVVTGGKNAGKKSRSSTSSARLCFAGRHRTALRAVTSKKVL